MSKLEIEFEANCYDGDWLIHCSVTYPAVGGHNPITVDYAELGDDDPEVVARRAGADIAGWMQDPQRWTENHIRHSPDNRLKLRLAQMNLERYQQQVKSYENSAVYSRRYVQETEADIAELKTKLQNEMKT